MVFIVTPGLNRSKAMMRMAVCSEAWSIPGMRTLPVDKRREGCQLRTSWCVTRLRRPGRETEAYRDRDTEDDGRKEEVPDHQHQLGETGGEERQHEGSDLGRGDRREPGEKPQHHGLEELEHAHCESEALIEVPVSPAAAKDVEAERPHSAHDELRLPASGRRPRHSGGVPEEVEEGEDRGDAEETSSGHRIVRDRGFERLRQQS